MGTRMSVYLSDDLKKRMDKTKEPVNWSSLACEAFERKLGEIASRKQEKKMDDVVQRLRASKLDGGSKLRKQGRDSGRDWATNRAEYEKLRLLARAVGSNQSNLDQMFGGDSVFSVGELLVRCLLPEDEFTRSDTVDFWAENGGADWERLSREFEYVCGFVEGAMDVWREVEDEI